MSAILGIILTILKILGIIIAVILGIVVLLVALILFSPFYYDLNASKEEVVKYKFRIFWTLGIISVKVYNNENNENVSSVRIFGIPLSFYQKIASVFKRKKSNEAVKNVKQKNTVIKEDSTQKSSYEEKVNKEELIEEPVEENVEEKVDETIKIEKKASLFDRIKDKIITIRNKIIKLFNDINNTIKKIVKVYEFITFKDNSKGIKKVLKSVKKLIVSILPYKIKGDIVFSTADPYTTGQILSILGMTYCLYGDKINVSSNFIDENYLKGHIFLKGKIRIFTLLIICYKLYKDDDFQILYNNYKRLDL